MSDREWVKWLADIGYGIDFHNDQAPPCTVRELADEYALRENGVTADYVWAIETSTGGW